VHKRAEYSEQELGEEDGDGIDREGGEEWRVAAKEGGTRGKGVGMEG